MIQRDGDQAFNMLPLAGTFPNHDIEVLAASETTNGPLSEKDDTLCVDRENPGDQLLASSFIEIVQV